MTKVEDKKIIKKTSLDYLKMAPKGTKPVKINNTYLRFALVGNPNCGKTTLFNKLTGSTQHIGNWPGVTVEKKEGTINFKDKSISVIDLPGIYSLSPYSPEEIVARNYIIEESPELIINIVDATNLERNLYLTTQLAELGRPMIIALNMIDLLEKRGDIVDFKLLEDRLGIPVIPISAGKGRGLDELLSNAVKTVLESKNRDICIKNIYSPDVELVLTNIEGMLPQDKQNVKMSKRWAAVKIFEKDKIVTNKFSFTQRQLESIAREINKIKLSEYIDTEMIIADQRYKYICNICLKDVITRTKPGQKTISDKLDELLTNRILAIPIFILIILFIFFITFGPIGNFFKIGMEWIVNVPITNFTQGILSALGASELSKGLILDGIIGGVGSIFSFLPQIILLFVLISILEDSGYMARAAFIMDRPLKKLGLSGRAFIPMLMGFGCTVPAVLATQTLENKKDRRLTILMTPFMSCSAKMPVYILFISAFFAENKTLIIFSIYAIGILLSIFTAFIFKNIINKDKDSTFVMELPQYHLPEPRVVFIRAWDKVKDFIQRAVTIILGSGIIVWFLKTFDFHLNAVSHSAESILASMGAFIAPIFSLCGFGDWRATVALITGLIAKESVVSTMAVLYNNVGGSLSLSEILQQVFSPLSAYSFMIFVLLYVPCFASIAAIKRQMESTKWTLIAIGYQLLIAWFISACVFQFGSLIMSIF